MIRTAGEIYSPGGPRIPLLANSWNSHSRVTNGREQKSSSRALLFLEIFDLQPPTTWKFYERLERRETELQWMRIEDLYGSTMYTNSSKLGTGRYSCEEDEILENLSVLSEDGRSSIEISSVLCVFSYTPTPLCNKVYISLFPGQMALWQFLCHGSTKEEL